MEKVKLGIVGGSGIYEIDGVQDGEWISVDTPFGAPSEFDDLPVRACFGGTWIV